LKLFKKYGSKNQAGTSKIIDNQICLSPEKVENGTKFIIGQNVPPLGVSGYIGKKEKFKRKNT